MAFLSVLFGSQAVANSQIKEDFAYAFGSSDGLDTGSIQLLSQSEMDEIEGLFIGWLMRMGPRAVRGLIEAFKIVRVELTNARRDGIEKNAWIRIGESWSTERGFVTHSIRWGSTNRHANRKVKNLVLREFNKQLYNLKIPINSWRTNDPGHLHIMKSRKKRSSAPRPPSSGPSGSAMRYAAANRDVDDRSVLSPELHSGESGVISSIDWETVTAEDLLTGIYDESLLTEAATGPTGTGRNARRWNFEDLTEKEVLLGLSILAFVSDPENNAGIDIPWLGVIEEYFSMAVYLKKNPSKNGRTAKLAKLGLKHLRYIIGQHSQDYHPPEDDSGQDSPDPAEDIDTLALTEASGADALTVDSSSTPPLDRNTYLPVNAHWWMHEFRAR